VPDVPTAISPERASSLLVHLSKVPEGFTPLRQMTKILERRVRMAKGELALDWGSAESLSYASLLTEKVHVRLTGQDTERGTFGHRNAVLHDVRTDATYTPLSSISPEQARFEVFNSPLSETGCMAFEFGYSLDYPDALVLWEAQFGDFANGAQVIIDQFIVAAEQKWRRLSGLVLLLPHGYEGAGPEHSSARLERFLDMSAEDNIQVVYPTTAAQLFHLLRRQALRTWRKPLVVMTPKSLLRREEAASPLTAFTDGSWQRVIGDGPEQDASRVTRLLLCSGKVGFDLIDRRATTHDASVAVARVEQLYPVPRAELEALVKRYPALRELFWVQEEPRNMGAWRFMRSHLAEVAATAVQPVTVQYVGRVESPSPATGFLKTHELEQHLLVSEAFARGTPNGD
jgi:2-oxoglutarate dehydrogenase E1 component